MDAKRLTAAFLAMAGTSLCAEHKAMAQSAAVTVCMDADPHLTGSRPLASAMFASIGVRIDWRDLDGCPIAIGAIWVELSYSTTVRRSEALAFARPYQGTIVVFVDRVQALSRNGVRSVMAHVLVHEVTHVLERTDRHSSTGIMKAHWDEQDYYQMRSKPLPFAQEDIDLIYGGLRLPRMASAAVMARGVAGP